MSFSLTQLSDLESIRNVAKLYCRGVDKLDIETMKLVYWPEATGDHGVFDGNAWQFWEMCMDVNQAWRATLHCIYNHSVELDDDGVHARGEIYNITHLFKGDSAELETWYGRYLDEYEKRGDEWRIIRRVGVHDGSTVTESPTWDMDTSVFRQGSFDRPSSKRPIGP